jgi:hypothetical protein
MAITLPHAIGAWYTPASGYTPLQLSSASADGCRGCKRGESDGPTNYGLMPPYALPFLLLLMKTISFSFVE